MYSWCFSLMYTWMYSGPHNKLAKGNDPVPAFCVRLLTVLHRSLSLSICPVPSDFAYNALWQVCGTIFFQIITLQRFEGQKLPMYWIGLWQSSQNALRQSDMSDKNSVSLQKILRNFIHNVNPSSRLGQAVYQQLLQTSLWRWYSCVKLLNGPETMF